MSKSERTTIMMKPVLKERVEKLVSGREDYNLTEFYNKAILNQLEREGDFEVRDLVEGLVE